MEDLKEEKEEEKKKIREEIKLLEERLKRLC